MCTSRPNVLLITADQLRYDCIGASGKYPVATPHLDALAAQGAFFTAAYSHFPVCGPARQSLLNGRRPETFGGLWNAGGGMPVASLEPHHYSWPRALAASGYDTAFLGKWSVHPKLGPDVFGYASVVGEADYKRFAVEHYPGVTYTNGFFGEPDPIPLPHARTHWLAARAAEQLERLRDGGKPWHMALHIPEPHLPCRPAGRFDGMYDPEEVPEWDGFRETFANKPYIQRQQLHSWGVERFDWDDWAPIVARYYSVVSQMDEAVGIVLDALERLGMADDTLVVFTADHGDMCGSHRMMDKHYIMYDDVVHVPLIVRLPGRTRPGTRCDRFVYSLLDLAPTVLDLAGLSDADSDGLHGRSLLPLLTDNMTDVKGGTASGTMRWRDAIVASYNGQQFGLYTQRMIRTVDWKYVWNLTDTDELYDLRRDPAELVNRIGDPAESGRVAELRRRLYDTLRADGDPAVSNDWMRRQLLGGHKV